MSGTPVLLSAITDRGQAYARQEVILSAGALDSPKLLLLSGIGPKEELDKYDIPVIHDLPGVGKNLHDHLWIKLVTTQKPGSHHRTSYISSPDAIQEARMQWAKDKTGPLSNYYLPQVISYLKSDRVKNSREFQELDSAVQEHFKADTKPNYEMISVSSFALWKNWKRDQSLSTLFNSNYKNIPLSFAFAVKTLFRSLTNNI